MGKSPNNFSENLNMNLAAYRYFMKVEVGFTRI